jgi:dTDP-4-dehydrorhamnose 3,5-epimerase
MPFCFESLDIPGVIVVKPQVFPDDRGFFMETYKYPEFAASGITEHFVQENHSFSRKGVIRGLHYQEGESAQGKLVQVIAGEIYDVVVDIQEDSPTYGEWTGVHLSAENKHMVYVPPTFAHGFCVVSDEAYVVYKVTHEYAPESEAGIHWHDPDLAIDWPVEEAQVSLSPRDDRWPGLYASKREHALNGGGG